MVMCTGRIGIHEGADIRTDGCTDVDDVMAIKPNFLTLMGYHIFLTMLLRARAELRYDLLLATHSACVHASLTVTQLSKQN